MNLFKVNGKFDLKKLIVSFLVTFVTALIGTIASIGAKEYYSTLNQPAFAPPGAVFAPVWTILFLLMATAAYRIWSYGLSYPGVKPALTLYLIQLILNFTWSILFFGAKNIFLALIEIVFLLIFIIITLAAFSKVDKWAAILLIPYLLLVGFATILNASIWLLNTVY